MAGAASPQAEIQCFEQSEKLRLRNKAPDPNKAPGQNKMQDTSKVPNPNKLPEIITIQQNAQWLKGLLCNINAPCPLPAAPCNC
jgi:hypothetical protein